MEIDINKKNKTIWTAHHDKKFQGTPVADSWIRLLNSIKKSYKV